MIRFIANYGGAICDVCDEVIAVGDEVVYLDADKELVHAECGEAIDSDGYDE